MTNYTKTKSTFLNSTRPKIKKIKTEIMYSTEVNKESAKCKNRIRLRLHIEKINCIYYIY